MPQVILHASSSIEAKNKTLLVHAIREAIPELLQIAENTGQVVLYESAPENRAAHSSRDPRFILAEASMYPGRSQEMKERFAHHLIYLIHKHTGTDPSDIQFIIHEIPPTSYFGGVSHEYIDKLRREGR